MDLKHLLVNGTMSVKHFLQCMICLLHPKPGFYENISRNNKENLSDDLKISMYRCQACMLRVQRMCSACGWSKWRL